jgi:transcription antitermination protein NusB
MLNRRILRVKAMQALYSYFLAQESQKNVTNEQLESHYLLDPAKDDFADANIFSKKRKLATKLYLECLPSKLVTSIGDDDKDIQDNVQRHIDKYYTEIDREMRAIQVRMMKDVDDIETLYLKLIQLIVEFAHIENQEKDKKTRAHIPKVSEWRYHFLNNPVIDALTKFEDFNKALIDNKISWQSDYDVIKSWYKEILQKDEVLIEYQKLENPTEKEHQDAVVYIYKKLVFKNSVIADYIASLDLHSSENYNILKSLVVKTFQGYEADLEDPFQLKEVSRNAEEDIDFFKKLFKETVRKERELDEIISKKTKNWDISRVALTDRIILRMALAEMMTFTSIPVKVTINEFIEISKNYSTPKSKQFINGILDVMANELTSEGLIRKSGRGLIDNK